MGEVDQQDRSAAARYCERYPKRAQISEQRIGLDVLRDHDCNYFEEALERLIQLVTQLPLTIFRAFRLRILLRR